ncbi:MAG TPA: cation:proton antiporter [Acidiferrobacteraceae bacterium]|nr:cation:proton antiporter [Acidiferrobacteraceae bacterium]
MSGGMVVSGIASRVQQSEALLFYTLLQLCVIVLAGRVGGELAVRMRQTAAVGEIIVGVLLGPSLLGWMAPSVFHYVFHSTSSAPIDVLSQLGLILLMFQIGLEFDFLHLRPRANRYTTGLIAVSSMVCPFVLGYAFGLRTAALLSPAANAQLSALFIGTAFSITALPILGRILIEFRLTRTPLGVVAISAAALNDVTGWLLLAFVTTLAAGPLDFAGSIQRVAWVVAFGFAWWWLVRPLLRRIVAHFQRPGEDLPPHLLGILLVAIFVSGMTTYRLGIFAIFGGFMMGVVLHDEARLVRAWRAQIGPFVLVFFLPIFFTYTGLRTDISGLNTPSLWGWCIAVTLLATLGKWGGAYGAARLAKVPHDAAQVFGVLMNTRALMELIVINIGLDVGAISRHVFSMLVIMSIVSTVITSPVLRRLLPRLSAAGGVFRLAPDRFGPGSDPAAAHKRG